MSDNIKTWIVTVSSDLKLDTLEGLSRAVRLIPYPIRKKYHSFHFLNVANDNGKTKLVIIEMRR